MNTINIQRITNVINVLGLLFLFASHSSALTLSSGQRIESLRSQQQRILVSTSQKTSSTKETELSGAIVKKSLFDLPEIEYWGHKHDLKEHHLKTLYKVVMNHHPAAEDQLSLREKLLLADFPKLHVDDLLQNFGFTCYISKVQESSSGGYKFVISLTRNNQKVETVLIKHERENSQERYTVCVSSQVGCSKKCSFCATGTMGLIGQLTSGEILEQVYLARNYLLSVKNKNEACTQKKKQSQNHKQIIRNCVYMGMGEPLDCYDEVHESLRGLTHQCLFGLKAKHLTISTVGASTKKIILLAEHAPQVSLALSLHSATQGTRKKLIPSAIPMKDLQNALNSHSEVMLEYLLIDNLNDSDEELEALVKFCQNIQPKSFVNLIPYNPTLAGLENGYKTPSDERINAFHIRLKERGIKSWVRWSSASGRDTNGACGQLVLN